MTKLIFIVLLSCSNLNVTNKSGRTIVKLKAKLKEKKEKDLFNSIRKYDLQSIKSILKDTKIIDINRYFIINNYLENIKNNTSITILLFAVTLQWEELVEIISSLEGIEIDKVDTSNHNTPLLIALSNNDFKIADILLKKGANINAVNKFFQNGILANINNLEVIKYCISKDIDLYYKDNLKETALKKAILVKNVESVAVLLEEDKNVTHDYLMTAIIMENIDIIKLIMIHYSKVNTENSEWFFIIIMAARSKDSTVFDLILDDYDINALDHKGRTVLQFAMYNFQYDVIKFLINKGANPYIKDNHGCTLIHYIVTLDFEQSNFNMLQSLLFIDKTFKEEDILKYILSSKYTSEENINSRDNDGLTALNECITIGKYKLIKILLDNDAKIDDEDKDVLKIILSSNNVS